MRFFLLSRHARVALVIVFLLSARAEAQENQEELAFRSGHIPYIGLYELESGERLIVGMYPGEPLFYFTRMSTGDVRFLEPVGEHAFSYGPTRSETTPVAGTIRFMHDDYGAVSGLFWTNGNDKPGLARRLPVEAEELRFENGMQAKLAGMLMTPPGSGPFPVAVLLTQSDRYDLWEVGMWVLSSGIGVLAYDQRNASTGQSTGDPVTGYYHEQQPVYASDAVAAVTFIRKHPRVEADRVGVVGWSGGGWMGAMVASEVPDLAFYVNIAGNASPGIDQAQHRFVARLLREGFSDEEVAEADVFLTFHHDVARGEVEWEEYASERERVSEKAWYTFLDSRFNMHYSDQEDATTWGSAVVSSPAERDYETVAVPTLGLFFEFDHSSTPETPLIFHRALSRAGNGHFAIYVFPQTNHGAWEVESYRFDTRKILRRSPEVFHTLASWVSRQLGLAR